MSKGYLPVDRDQIRIPLSIRQGVPAEHPVWMVITLMENVLDTSALHTKAKLGGRGRAPYDPTVLATLLIWGQMLGTQSCQAVALQCHTDLAFQAICGDHRPSASTLEDFRGHLLTHIDDLNEQVLQLVALAGLGDFSYVGIDGVKLAANASKKANRREDTLRRMLTELDAADAADGHGRSTASARAARAGRRARIQQALDELVTAAHNTAAHNRAADTRWLSPPADGAHRGRPPTGVRLQAAEHAYQQALQRRQALLADWQTRNAAATAAGHKGLRGTPPQVETHSSVLNAAARLHRETTRAHDQAATPPDTPSRKATARKPARNITDPDSRLMPIHSGGFVQGYNCQSGATRDGILPAGLVTQDTNDLRQCQPMLTAIAHALTLFINTRLAAGYPCTCTPHPATPPDPHTTPIDAARQHTAKQAKTCQVHIGLVIIWVLLDAGYLSTDNITTPGPPRLIALGKTRDQTTAATHTPTHGPPNPHTNPITQMSHLLRTPEGAAAYKHRGPIAERPFAQLKHNINIDTLHTRGLTTVTNEWTLLRTCNNLQILTNHLRKTHTDLADLATLLHRARTTLATTPT
jgi:transposase